MEQRIERRRFLELAAGRFAHCSGALWLAEERTAIIADAHLGYAWAQRRRGELGPVADGGIGERFEALLAELAPRRMVFLGDVVHAPEPAPDERRLIERQLRELSKRVEVHIVTGNHDRAFGRDFAGLGIPTSRELSLGDGWFAIHGDRLPKRMAGTLVTGHFHPAVPIIDAAGHKQRVRVFAVSPNAIVLPAFSPFAAGLNLRRDWPAELTALLGERRGVRTFAITGARVLELPFGRPPKAGTLG